ncbi:cobalamin biosynthesis protein CobW [Magnetospira sp. QH-2]|uniref:cobalamin biosynthesis protein CobW n=1 Tax=Magnetospira sp. (strain QH-2) TaxID=1288970 RepID=UPI0003E80B47|nr:cobalamin biosynthesis protein CobW [Magnetospira sp. QH-2]CCQ72041.1 cobalamin synthesis protein cobW [Magnetospira sp. QH-2]
MKPRIPATVITGFLGAGKTTLIRHLIETANGRRLALIINEFGDLGVDKELLSGCGIDGCNEDNLIELSNGCLCCTVADEFLPTIQKLLDQPSPPDHIVIETSGLALPRPLVKAFDWPEVRSRVTVDGVVAVVDTPAVAEGRFAFDPDAVADEAEADGALAHDDALEELFEDQLACADLVILNKTDLTDDETLGQALATVQGGIRQGVSLIRADHGRVDGQVVLGLEAAAEDDLAARPSHHDGPHDDHDHDDFESFIVDLGPIADPEALEGRVRAAAEAHDILRVKGFLDVPGKPLRHVLQAVGPRIERYFDRPWKADEARASRLVVIGHHGLDRPGIATLLAG